MERFVKFFRVRKVLFSYMILLGLAVAGIVFVGPTGTAWVIIPVLVTIGSAIGSIYGIYVMCAQLAVEKQLSVGKELSYRKQLKKLQKERVSACLEYYGTEDSRLEHDYLSKVKRLDREIAEWTGSDVK